MASPQVLQRPPERKRSLNQAFPIYSAPQQNLLATNTTTAQQNTFGFKKHRLMEQPHFHQNNTSTGSSSSSSSSSTSSSSSSSSTTNNYNGQQQQQQQRKRGVDAAFPPSSSALSMKGGFAGFGVVNNKRHRTQKQTNTLSTPCSSSSSSSTTTTTNNNNNNNNNQRKRGLDAAFPVHSSSHFGPDGVHLLDEGQGFAGFSPMKRSRSSQQPSHFSVPPPQQRSPDENQPLSKISANKRDFQQFENNNGSSDIVMRKRGHLSTPADEELDRPVFSKRYMAQIEQQMKYTQQNYETKLRRDCANEIAAVKANAARIAAEASSRIALENERLRHENFVLKQGVRIQDERNKKLQMKIGQLERANYALCLRNAGNHSGIGMNSPHGDNNGRNGDVY